MIAASGVTIQIIRIPYTKLDTLTIEDIKLETSAYIIHG